MVLKWFILSEIVYADDRVARFLATNIFQQFFCPVLPILSTSFQVNCIKLA